MSNETSIRQMLSRMVDDVYGRRYAEVFKYPETVSPEELFEKCQRGIGYRVATVYAKSTWREMPKVDGTDEFVAAFNALDEKVNLLSTLAKLDMCAGFGHYAVLVLGVRDGNTMDMPINTSIPLELDYIQPYGEKSVKVFEWDINPVSRRFGQPLQYQITRKSPNPQNMSMSSFNVHWSRVVHIAEDATDDITYGVCRPELVINNLIDLEKLLGGGAELYWKNAASLYNINIPETDIELDPADVEKLKADWQEMEDGLTRVVRTRGMNVSNISPGLMGADPSTLIDKEIDFMSGTLAVPKRLLVGSEAGELASSQDENNWAGRITERRNIYVIPGVITKAIRQLIAIRILPVGFNSAYWNDGDSLGEEKRALIAVSKTQALMNYKNTIGGDEVISPIEFRRWLGETGALPLDAIEEQLLAESGDDGDAIRELESDV